MTEADDGNAGEREDSYPLLESAHAITTKLHNTINTSLDLKR